MSLLLLKARLRFRTLLGIRDVTSARLQVEIDLLKGQGNG